MAGNDVERVVSRRETVPDRGAQGGEMLGDEVRAAHQPPTRIGGHVPAGTPADPEHLTHKVEQVEVFTDVGQRLEQVGALESAFGDRMQVQVHPGDREPGG